MSHRSQTLRPRPHVPAHSAGRSLRALRGLMLSGALPLLATIAAAQTSTQEIASSPAPRADRAGHAATEAAALLSLADALRHAAHHDPYMRSLNARGNAIAAGRRDERSLPNPELSLSSRQGGGERFGDNAEVELQVNAGAVLSAPWRFREVDARALAARAGVEEARSARRLEVAAAWYRAVTAHVVSGLEADAASAWEAEAELARRRRDAGTLNALDLAETEAAAAQARIAAGRAAREAEIERAALAGLLGLGGAEAVALRVADSLPPPPEEELLPGPSAGRGAPALIAARAEAEAARRSAQAARVAVLPRLTAGATWERDGRGATALAPEVGLEVPLFNPGFARRARARAEHEAAAQRAAARESETAARLRALHAALDEAREAYASWNDAVLPLRRRAADEALRHYNFMLVGADRLLAARREELSARRARVEALRDYWITRAARDEAVGRPPEGPLASSAPRVDDAPSTAVTTTKATPPNSSFPQATASAPHATAPAR